VDGALALRTERIWARAEQRPQPDRVAGVNEVPVVEIPRLVGVHHEAVVVPLLDLGREAGGVSAVIQ